MGWLVARDTDSGYTALLRLTPGPDECEFNSIQTHVDVLAHSIRMSTNCFIKRLMPDTGVDVQVTVQNACFLGIPGLEEPALICVNGTIYHDDYHDVIFDHVIEVVHVRIADDTVTAASRFGYNIALETSKRDKEPRT